MDCPKSDGYPESTHSFHGFSTHTQIRSALKPGFDAACAKNTPATQGLEEYEAAACEQHNGQPG